MEEYRYFVGIDWATREHQVCIVDENRKVIDERKVEHTGTAILQLAERLTRLEGNPSRVAVAIEVPRGAIVETLVERGFHVYALNPKQLDRFRDRHTVAGAKDDRRDAFVLADSVRTDLPCFHRVHVDDPLVIQIRELSRIHEDLCGEANRLQNRLREQLHRYFPQLLRLCPAANEPWLWALLERVPTPEMARRVRLPRVEKVLQAHRIRRLTPAEVLSEMRTPALKVAPGATEAAVVHIVLLIPRLRLVHQQRTDSSARIEKLLAELCDDEEKTEHRDVQILRSLPGVGRVVTATMLAEAAQAVRNRDYRALRAHGGIAPITKQSGRRRHVIMRYGCNSRLRNAFYHWARVSTQVDARCQAQYHALRARGHSHGRALRGVGDRLLRILVAMLRDQTDYDPTRAGRALSTAQPAVVNR
jgi:transposase